MSALRRGTGPLALVVCGLLTSYAYFYQAGGWNQNSRFALVRAILEEHTLRIDSYQLHTGDRALFQGHYYSDKAPGSSMLALVPSAAARGIGYLAGVDPTSFQGIAWTSYAATVATAGFFTAMAAALVGWLLIGWGYSMPAALFAATAYGIASPAWCYATLFMGHGLTAGCLMFAFTAAAWRRPPDGSHKTSERLDILLGLFVGLAVLSEFPAAVPGGVIAALRLLPSRGDADPRIWPRLWRIIAGGAAPALALFAYNTLAFGSPLHLGYSSEEGFDQMRSGLFGISYPTWTALHGVLLSEYRGLLPLAPLFAVGPVGVWALAKRSDTARPAAVAALVAGFYLLLNASYYYWEGGWAYGPRHVTPALPFVALGLGPLWDRWASTGRTVLCAGWIWGAALTLVAVSTTPQPPSSLTAPVSQLLWPAFLDGDLSLNHQTFVHHSAQPDLLRGHRVPHAAWNLGELAGLRGLWSLLPLFALWGAIVAVLLL
jgi:hypothetical protein